MIELRNESKNNFVDISSEEYRVYTFAYEGNLSEVKISEPLYLAVSNSGHRILDNSGISHYIPKGWFHLSWKAKEGEPHFVK
jgi:hypothetical protein